MCPVKLTLLPQEKAVPQKPPFEEVFARYYSGAVSYTCNKIGNVQDAEDLCSESFLYCYDHYDDFDPAKSSISTWLYLILNSRIKNYYRDHKSYSDLDELQNILPDEDTDLERGVYLQQLRGMLANALERLPQRQQEIVIMHYFQDMTSQQIAEALDMTPGNVRVQLSRALDKLESLCADFR